MDSEKYDETKKSWIQENCLSVPCMRKTLFTSISGCMFAGLGYFLFTSNASKSYSFTKKSFFGIGILTWCYCRYQYAQAKIRKVKLREALTSKDDPDFEHKLEMDLKEVRRMYGSRKS